MHFWRINLKPLSVVNQIKMNWESKALWLTRLKAHLWGYEIIVRSFCIEQKFNASVKKFIFCLLNFEFTFAYAELNSYLPSLAKFTFDRWKQCFGWFWKDEIWGKSQSQHSQIWRAAILKNHVIVWNEETNQDRWRSWTKEIFSTNDTTNWLQKIVALCKTNAL